MLPSLAANAAPRPLRPAQITSKIGQPTPFVQSNCGASAWLDGGPWTNRNEQPVGSSAAIIITPTPAILLTLMRFSSHQVRFRARHGGACGSNAVQHRAPSAFRPPEAPRVAEPYHREVFRRGAARAFSRELVLFPPHLRQSKMSLRAGRTKKQPTSPLARPNATPVSSKRGWGPRMTLPHADLSRRVT